MAATEQQKMRLDLHCHSEASADCVTPLASFPARCRARGIRVQAITDHNEVWGAQKLKEMVQNSGADDLTIIVGEEVSTREGEIVGLFLNEKIPAGLSPEETVAAIKNQGGLVLLPHGFDPLKRHRLKPEALERVQNDIDIVEVFNARISTAQVELGGQHLGGDARQTRVGRVGRAHGQRHRQRLGRSADARYQHAAGLAFGSKRYGERSGRRVDAPGRRARLQGLDFRTRRGAQGRVTLMRPPLLPRPENLAAASDLQRELAGRVVLEGDLAGVKTLAALDASIKTGQALFAVAVLWDIESEKVLEVGAAKLEPNEVFPYVPGFLSFREAPVYLAALAQLSREPGLLLVDGQGVAHPRGLGIAAHLGVHLDMPSIGVAKSRLYGKQEGELDEVAGSAVPLVSKGAQSGWVYRSRTGVKPLYLSPGHRAGIAETLEFVRSLPGKTKLPNPLKQAHEWAGKSAQRKVDRAARAPAPAH